VDSVEYLDIEDLLYLIRRRDLGTVRDLGLLESACARPQTAVFGREVYPSLELKAAALLHSLVRNHALVDGNKRLAWYATAVFLHINGQRARISKDAAFDLTMDAAQGLVDVEEIAARLTTTP